MTERRDDEREKSFREEKRRPEERERRSDALKEAWRRNHPSEPQEEGLGRPKKGDREAHSRRQSRGLPRYVARTLLPPGAEARSTE
jgi:hypothetical protein